MNDLMIFIIIAGFVFIGIFLSVIRKMITKTIVQQEESPVLAHGVNVEYEWETKSHGVGKFLSILGILAAIGYGIFIFLKDANIGEDLYKALFAGAAIILSFLSNFFKRYHFRITNIGLYREELKKGTQTKEMKLLFSWKQLEWIEPNDKGFRYHLRKDMRDNGFVKGINVGQHGFVDGGENPILVNSLIMSRGIPNTKPGEMTNR